MRLLIAGLLIASSAVASAVTLQDRHPGPATPASACARTNPYYAYQDDRPLKPRKLTELPPAHAFSAVFRKIDGCEAPILIKYRVGGR